MAQGLIIDHSCTDPGEFPDSVMTQIRESLVVAYNHTSHGSQLVSGMDALRRYPPCDSRYEFSEEPAPSTLEFHDRPIPGVPDLSQGDYIDEHGVTPWVTSTREFLDSPANGDINVVIWSWCSINGHNIERYLENMELLVAEYGFGGSSSRSRTSPVTFVFMTGHAEGQGEDGFIYQANQEIRDHCVTHDRVLFDFADIESFDPDGIYYYDLPMWDNLDYGTEGGNWAVEWVQDNPLHDLTLLASGAGMPDYDGCLYCAHSDNPAEAKINCVLKGAAVWYMLARITGWNPEGESPLAQIELLSADLVRLEWSRLLPGQVYLIEESDNATLWSPLATFLADGTTETVELGIAPGTRRLFRVRMETR